MKKNKLKKFSLYTFDQGKYCYTETETVDQAIKNFNRRLNLDVNGYNHPNMLYKFKPIRIITVDKPSSEDMYEETVLKYNLDDLNKLIIEE
jgi:hypothetical protein|tara:strand:- start:498 stop:770 length:273 start_codon:yes stop_codon:yes gene_type:complete